jgi:ABC-type antimicrobial peptide transport system permease subunit
MLIDDLRHAARVLRTTPALTVPVMLVLAVVVLTAVALLASWLPARNAARVSPIDALRTE